MENWKSKLIKVMTSDTVVEVTIKLEQNSSTYGPTVEYITIPKDSLDGKARQYAATYNQQLEHCMNEHVRMTAVKWLTTDGNYTEKEIVN